MERNVTSLQNRKWSLHFLFSSLLFLLSSVCVLAAEPIRICCVGNSITYGYGMKNREVDSYPAVLQSLLGDKAKVMNAGFNSRTMLMTADKPYMKEKLFHEALAFEPEIVVIKLGTNDTKPQNWTTKEAFMNDMNTMIDSFAAIKSRPEIFLCYPIPTTGSRWGINDTIIRTQIIPAIKRVARQRGLKVINLYKKLKPHPELISSDNIHPNRQGYKAIANSVSDFLKRKSKKLKKSL